MSNFFTERFRAKRAGTKSPLKPMTPDDSFTYLVGRALSTWPVCNGNQAAFVEDDFGTTRGMKSVIGTKDGFVFGLVNANHSVGPGKSNRVLGTIREEALVPGVGVDILAQIDKRACLAFDISPEEFAADGDFSDISIEILCDRDRSTFVAITAPGSTNLEDQTIFTAEEAAAAGVRRTNWATDPYLYKDQYVVAELCSPIRCRGVALLPDPADKTANIFEVAASMEKSLKDRLKEAHKEEHERRKTAVKETLKEHGLDIPENVDRALDRALGVTEGGKLDALIDSITTGDEDAAKHVGGILVPKKYADIDDREFADPGFRGKKRYPVDTAEHVRAAAAYFGKPANRDKYTHEQQQHIIAKINAAKKHFGIDEEENSAFASTDAPTITPTSGIASGMMGSYDDTDPLDISSSQEDLPDDAFADTFFNPEEDADERQYPMYASAENYRNNRPHAGLVKAALQAHIAGKMKNPALALQRLQVAHAQLHGAKSMDDKDTLATENAALKTQMTEIQAAQAEANEKIAALETENAALKAAAAARDAEELANARLAKLSAIEGFSIKDEEKAALIEVLKTEDELVFENRVLKATVSAMEEAAKAHAVAINRAKEEKAALDAQSEEIAALNGLDVIPNGFAKKTDITFIQLV